MNLRKSNKQDSKKFPHPRLGDTPVVARVCFPQEYHGLPTRRVPHQCSRPCYPFEFWLPRLTHSLTTRPCDHPVYQKIYIYCPSSF